MRENSDSLSFFVLGSDSQVGMALCQYLYERQIVHFSLTVNEMQSEALLKERISSTSCKFVVNAAFEEPCIDLEVDTQWWLASANAIANTCIEQNKILLHLSSAKVFSGKNYHAYVETDLPDASSKLGQEYIAIEQLISKQCTKYIILRTSWLFGEQPDNYLNCIVSAAIERDSLKVSGKLYGCPTDVRAVAKVMVGMAEQLDCDTDSPSLWGIYNYVDSDACSMYTFAKTVITAAKSMTDVRVESIEESNTTTPMPFGMERENHELSCKKILSTFGIKQRPWRRGIHEVLNVRFGTK